MAEFASRGVGIGGLTTGIIGTALGVLNGGVGNVLGNGTGWGAYGCSEDHVVNRYELGQAQEISALKADIALRDANTYGDQKMLELYKYIDGKLGIIDTKLCDQAVHNQRTQDSFMLVRQDLEAVKSELCGQIAMEAERRCCGDNSIVTYANATFYPKMVADITTGTTTTAQTLYNPLPSCGGCCNK